MRRFLIVLFLAMLVSFTLEADVITRFPSLQDNERLAHSTRRERRNPTARHIWTPVMTLYAVRDNNIEDASVLFTWDNVPWFHIQFSNDLKMCFFIVETVIASDPVAPSVRRDLYVANGISGEVRRLLTGMGSAAYCISKDGRFILHLSSLIRDSRNYSVNLFNLYLIDVEKGGILDEFEWRLNRSEYANEMNPVEGLDILAIDSIFRLLAVGYRELIIAEAEYDPGKMKLRTLFIR